MSDDKETEQEDEAHPLSRLEDERGECHRGFILYACQDSEKRSMRLVARAVGRDESTVRNWSRKKKWKERLAECGPGSQTMALSI